MNANHANLPNKAQWIGHIQALIKGPIEAVPFYETDDYKRVYVEDFADEYGNRRATDKPFVSYLLGLESSQPAGLTFQPDALDQSLWWMIQVHEADEGKIRSMLNQSGPLVVDTDELAIEYRTMVELCALHALWILARRTHSDELKARCLEAARWHTQELQPDNAINRPWATPVFIELSHTASAPETRHLGNLHAQTLIHNCSINLGYPDMLSAMILKDTVDQLLES